ncbi:serine hydrolase domain-containing protein [Kitasatospora sp. NPDC096147]|uniref:serine hydrolase domain-containing protein n=1 Tax=Kitasatospora sp. NPDC096147 TaxID=3364093 RepID=UPI003823BBA2
MADDLGALAQRTADGLARDRAGVVVAALAGGQVEIRAAGAVGVEDVFEIGSVTKVFTALALAALVVEGTVSLDQPLAELLPEAGRLTKDGAAVTLGQLAQHTSGLPRLPHGMLLRALLRPSAPDPYAGLTEPVLLGTLAKTRLGAVPGRRHRYSNLGAGLLGLALARRTGTDYEGLIARQVTGPLGLPGITVAAGRPQVQGHDRKGRPVAAWQLAALAGAGGLHATAGELAGFLKAQLEPEQSALTEPIALSRSVRHPVTPFAWAHLGWLGQQLHAKQGGRVELWHNGGTGGFSSFVGLSPECGTGVVALANTQRSVDGPAFSLLRELSAASDPGLSPAEPSTADDGREERS